MSSIAAPVVPMKEAIAAPNPRNSVFTPGLARMSPARWIPPEMTNNARSKMMNCAYSTSASATGIGPSNTVMYRATGIPSASATSSLLRLLSRQRSVAGMRGRIAIHSSSAANGITVYQPRVVSAVTLGPLQIDDNPSDRVPGFSPIEPLVVGDEPCSDRAVGRLIDQDERAGVAVPPVRVDHQRLGCS